MNPTNSVITITFGECAENHKGMEMLGTVGSPGEGFSLVDLIIIRDKLAEESVCCEIIPLHLGQEFTRDVEPAFVLVIRQGVKYFGFGSHLEMFNEMKDLPLDKKAFMYGRVVNKHARWNVCFSDVAQEPDYEQKKGTVIAWSAVPNLNQARLKLVELLGTKGSGLKAEGNFYYDKTKCGISPHGDSERRRVVAIRLGADMPLYFQWYKDNKPTGTPIAIQLIGGDLYIMSEKAVGTDWKRPSIYTLRHMTGCEKFTGIKTIT